MWTTVIVIQPQRQFRSLVLTLQWHILMWTAVLHHSKTVQIPRTDPTVTHLDVNNSDTPSKTVQIPRTDPTVTHLDVNNNDTSSKTIQIPRTEPTVTQLDVNNSVIHSRFLVLTLQWHISMWTAVLHTKVQIPRIDPTVTHQSSATHSKFRSLVLTLQWHISMWTAVLHTQSSDPSYWPYSDTSRCEQQCYTLKVQIPRIDPTVTHLDVNSSATHSKFRSLVLTLQWHISMWTAVLHTQSSDPSYWPYSDTSRCEQQCYTLKVQIPRTDPTVTHLDVNNSDTPS